MKMWIFDGKHKLICGDSLNEEVWKELEGFDLVITDPPYKFEHDEWFDYVWKYGKEDLGVFVWGSDKMMVRLGMRYYDYFRYFLTVELISPQVFSSNIPITAHDLIGYWNRGKNKFMNRKDGFTTHFKMMKRGKGGKRYIKDTKILKSLVLHYAGEDDVILDCFAGSGSLLFVVESLNRQTVLFGENSRDNKVWLVEINEKLCRKIVENYKSRFGGKVEEVIV